MMRPGVPTKISIPDRRARAFGEKNVEKIKNDEMVEQQKH
jgi:hypothetical protein